MKISKILVLAFFLFGCQEYKFGKQTCSEECKRIQEDNVGSIFVPYDMSFGSCICYGKDGTKKKVYVRIKTSQ